MLVQKINSPYYSLFSQFIETYAPVGFKGIDPADPLMLEIEKMTEKHNQFFLIIDFVQLSLLYVSKRSAAMLGIKPADLDPLNYFEATHPDDLFRHSLGRSLLFKRTQTLFAAEKGYTLLSTNLLMRNPAGAYSNLFLQCLLYYSMLPYKTVYMLIVHTDIGWYAKMKNGFHYYLGNDLSYFRLPDEELIAAGLPFTSREFELIMLIKSELNSEQIAEKLFLSQHTVNTHRKNILKKAGKKNMQEVIFDLMDRGLL